MNIQTATKEFEDWVSRHTDVIKSQLSDKHKQTAESPVQFLRGVLTSDNILCKILIILLLSTTVRARHYFLVCSARIIFLAASTACMLSP
jgi:hypothetical protein